MLEDSKLTLHPMNQSSCGQKTSQTESQNLTKTQNFSNAIKQGPCTSEPTSPPTSRGKSILVHPEDLVRSAKKTEMTENTGKFPDPESLASFGANTKLSPTKSTRFASFSEPLPSTRTLLNVSKGNGNGYVSISSSPITQEQISLSTNAGLYLLIYLLLQRVRC